MRTPYYASTMVTDIYFIVNLFIYNKEGPKYIRLSIRNCRTTYRTMELYFAVLRTFERIRQCSDSSKGLFFIACNSTVFYFRAIELSRARNTLKNINIDSTLISLHFPTFFSLICDDSYDWIMLKLRGSEALETTMCYEFVRHPGAQLLHICDGVQDTTDAQQICIFCD